MANCFGVALLVVLVLATPGNGQHTPPSTVQVTATPSAPNVLKGVVNTLYVQLEIEALASVQEAPQRTPFELAVVLDRSGSMSGAKLERAKASITNIISNLLPNDILHLVAYDDSVEVAFQHGSIENSESLKQIVERIVVGGMTNLNGGLAKAYALLAASSSTERTKRVFLFSDGLVNVGVTDHDTILSSVRQMHREKRISTSAFGIGEDFDEKLMTKIGEHGNGDYYFIGNEQDTEKVVAVGLKGVLNLAATDVLLKLKGINGATVTKIFGFPNDAISTGAKLTDVRLGGRKKVVAKLEIQPPSQLNEAQILEYTLQYSLPANADGQKHELKGVVRVQLTDDDNVAALRNEQVMSYVDLQLASEQEVLAREALEKGKVEEAKAYHTGAAQMYAKSSAPEAATRLARSKLTQKVIEEQGASKSAMLLTSWYASKNLQQDDFDNEL